MSNPKDINKQIYRLALPNIISNFSIPLLGAVDTALMGRLESEDYLGAVGIGGVLFSFIYWGFGFLRMATTGTDSTSLRRKGPPRMRTLAAESDMHRHHVKSITPYLPVAAD